MKRLIIILVSLLFVCGVSYAEDEYINGVLQAGWSGSTNLTVNDEIELSFGTNDDWKLYYDEDVDDQLLFITANTTAIADTDPMFEIITGTSMDADQQIFGIAKGTQASNTSLFSVDEDGDVVIANNITTTGNATLSLFSGNLTLTYLVMTAPVSGYDFKIVNDQAAGNHWEFVSGSTIELTDADGEQSHMYLEPHINQSSTAAYNGLKIQVLETATGDGSTGTGAENNLIAAGTSASPAMFRMASDGDLHVGPATAIDNNVPSFNLTGDADSDGAAAVTSDTFKIALTANATPTSATWDFTSTQSAGYTFDNNISLTNAAGPALLNETPSATNPTLVPNKAEPTSGFSWSSAGVLRFVSAGTNIGGVSSVGVFGNIGGAAAGVLSPNDATATVPALSFAGDLDTGAGSAAADQLSLIAGGVEGIRIEENAGNIAVKFGGDVPVLSSCGSTPSITGSSSSGKVTIGTGATQSCTVTFDQTFTAAPACVIAGDNNAIGYAATTSATVLTITSSADMASDVISYICVGIL